MLFAIGDYIAGIVIGVITALAVRAVIWPGMDMVIAMLLGMAIGMALDTILGLVVAPLLGISGSMLAAQLIGMYGGMLFAMRDSMAAGSRTHEAAALVGAIFGAIVVLGVKVLDGALHGPVLETEL